MNIIIPMAGKGKRMRPHTLTTPKPLIKVAGFPIVQRLVEDITKTVNEKIEIIAFVIGEDFGSEVENSLLEIAKNQGAKAVIYYQTQALGTAHAIMCAKESIKGKTIVAFADTLFKVNFKMDTNADGIIWVHYIDDPSQFGVVKVNDKKVITQFVEKPQTPISNLAIIGIYYFKDGENLKSELQHLLDNNITEKGEFQLTNALENMKNKGLQLTCESVTEWLDCGSIHATIATNTRLLEFDKDKKNLKGKNITIENSIIIEPCYIGDNVILQNSIVGPYASIGSNSKLMDVRIKKSIVQSNTKINHVLITDSMIGESADIKGTGLNVSISDFTTLHV